MGARGLSAVSNGSSAPPTVAPEETACVPADMAVPLDLKQRTRDYFRFTRDLFRKKSYGDLYDVFSPKLRGDVLCHIAIKTLEAVYYFKGCERGFLNALSQRLTHLESRVLLLEVTIRAVFTSQLLASVAEKGRFCSQHRCRYSRERGDRKE